MLFIEIFIGNSTKITRIKANFEFLQQVKSRPLIGAIHLSKSALYSTVVIAFRGTRRRWTPYIQWLSLLPCAEGLSYGVRWHFFSRTVLLFFLSRNAARFYMYTRIEHSRWLTGGCYTGNFLNWRLLLTTVWILTAFVI